MNTYVLVLTMIFNSGYAGMGGIESIRTTNLYECKKAGEAWVKDVKSRRRAAGSEVFYTCLKIKEVK